MWVSSICMIISLFAEKGRQSERLLAFCLYWNCELMVNDCSFGAVQSGCLMTCISNVVGFVMGKPVGCSWPHDMYAFDSTVVAVVTELDKQYWYDKYWAKGLQYLITPSSTLHGCACQQFYNGTVCHVSGNQPVCTLMLHSLKKENKRNLLSAVKSSEEASERLQSLARIEAVHWLWCLVCRVTKHLRHSGPLQA